MSLFHSLLCKVAEDRNSIPVTIKAQEDYVGTDFTDIVGTITDPLGTIQSFSQGTTVSVRPNVQYTIDITSISTGSGNEPVLYNSQFAFTLGGSSDNYYFDGNVLLVKCKYASRMVINLYDYTNSQQLPSTTQVKYDVYVGTTPVMQDVVVDNGYIIHLKSILDQISTLAGTTINTIGLKITGILDANSQPITDFESIDNTQWLTLNNDYSITLTGDNFTLSPTSFANNGTIININLSIPDYLCFTALESGTFTLTVPAAVTSTNLSYVEWSLDGRNWTRLTVDSTAQTLTTPTVAVGGKVYWRGSGVSTGSSESKVSGQHTNFSATADFNVSGNIMSLLYPTNFEVTSFPNGSLGFCNLFKGNSHLISAEDLSLSVTTPVSYCFFGLFLNCTGLIKAPSIPLTTFSNTSMVCRSMFSGCTSLVKAPDLPVAVLASQSYYQMFYGCTSLNYVKCLATDISATNCLSSWLNGVSATGTFIKAQNVTYPSGGSGIPSTWLIYDEGGARLPIQYKEVEYVETGARSANNRIEIGTIRNQYEVFEVKAQAAQLDTTYNQAIAGYSEVDTTTTPKQASQSYFYLRANPDSFQHQIYRINGDSYSSSNGLLQNTRDTSVHTYKIDYEISSSTGHHIRRPYFDGTLKTSSTETYETMKSGTVMCLFGTTNDNSNAYLRIMEFKWFESDGVTLYKHLIPCKRVSDSKAGYFDLIGKAFFTSVNNLTAGAEI